MSSNETSDSSGVQRPSETLDSTENDCSQNEQLNGTGARRANPTNGHDGEVSGEDDDDEIGDSDDDSDGTEEDDEDGDEESEEGENETEVDPVIGETSITAPRSPNNEPTCYICLNEFEGQDVGSPDSCENIHHFCLECIEEWSKVLSMIVTFAYKPLICLLSASQHLSCGPKVLLVYFCQTRYKRRSHYEGIYLLPLENTWFFKNEEIIAHNRVKFTVDYKKNPTVPFDKDYT